MVMYFRFCVPCLVVDLTLWFPFSLKLPRFNLLRYGVNELMRKLLYPEKWEWITRKDITSSFNLSDLFHSYVGSQMRETILAALLSPPLAEMINALLDSAVELSFERRRLETPSPKYMY